MRIRTIKPSFFKDEEIADLPPLCRLLFQGLWLMADAQGRLEDRPRRIKAECLPYDDVDVDEMLQLLHDRRFIVRYEVDGRACIYVRNFLKHQRLSGKEAEVKSELPAFDEAMGKQRGSNGEAMGKQRGSNGEATGKHPESQEGKGRERKGKERERAREEISEPDPESPLSNLAGYSFQKFKSTLPWRQGKFLEEDECQAYWDQHPAMWNQWIRAAGFYRESKEVLDGVICKPMTFLKRKWRDFLSGEQPLGQSSPEPDRAWEKQREQWDAETAEYDRKVAAGEIVERPRPVPAWKQPTPADGAPAVDKPDAGTG